VRGFYHYTGYQRISVTYGSDLTSFYFVLILSQYIADAGADFALPPPAMAFCFSRRTDQAEVEAQVSFTLTCPVGVTFDPIHFKQDFEIEGKPEQL
jgi:hypothetical protein